MSTKRAQQAQKAAKRPKNLRLDEETIEKGLKLAQAENRNFSNEVTALIAREFQRVFPNEAAKEQLELLKAGAAVKEAA